MKSLVEKEENKNRKSFIEFLVYAHLWPEDSSIILQVVYHLLSEIQLCSIILWFQFSYLSNTNHNHFTQLLQRASEIVSLHSVLIQSEVQFFRTVEIIFYIAHGFFALTISRQYCKVLA